MRIWLAAACSLSLFVAIGITYSSPLYAQVDSDVEAENDILSLAPRTLRREITEAEKALREKRYADVVESLGKILIEPPEDGAEGEFSQDYYLNIKRQGLITGSVRSTASDLLGQLPKEERKLIELRFGVAAQKKLDAALENGDWSEVDAVARQYFHTQAGFEANYLLAQRLANQGRPMAACLLLERLLKTPAAADQIGPSIALLLANQWLEVGRKDLATSALQRAETIWPGAELKWRGNNYRFNAKSDWATTVVDLMVARSMRSEQLGAGWSQLGGKPERNGEGTAGVPLSAAQWRVSIARGRPDELRLEQYIRNRTPDMPALIPSIQPVLIGNTVITKTMDHCLQGVNLETGKREWINYFSSSRPEAKTDYFNIRQNTGDPVSDQLAQRVWAEVPYWQLSSDANKVYMITTGDSTDDNLGLGAPGLQPRFMNFGAMTGTSNFLEACSLEGQGKRVWRVGGSTGEDEPALAGAFFLSPPLPLEGILYCLVEVNGETSAVALQASSGKVVWSQQLAQSVLLGFGDEYIRQIKGAIPAYSDGILICPTGNGVIIAMDVASRTLRWAYRYRSTAVGIDARGGGFNPMMRAEFDPLREGRWSGVPVTIADGRVVIAATDCESLICLDLLSGERLWEQRRGTFRYVGGIHNGKCIVVGDNLLTAVDLADGKPAWSETLSMAEPQKISGIGVRRGNRYFLPTNMNEVMEIDINDGKVLSRTKVSEPVGNLVAFREMLLSVSPTGITLFHTLDDVQKQVAQRIAKDPLDPWAAARNAEILISRGEKSAAFDALRVAYQRSPDNDEIRFLLVETLLAALQNDYEQYQSLAVEFEKLIDLPTQRVQFLIAMIRGTANQGDKVVAFGRLFELSTIRNRINGGVVFERDESLQLEPDRRVDVDRWMLAQTGRLYNSATPEQQVAMGALLQPAIDAAMTGSIADKEKVLNHFASVPLTKALAMKYARELVAEGGGRSLLIAERILMANVASADVALRAEAIDSLMQIYQRSERTVAAKNLATYAIRSSGDASGNPVAAGSGMTIDRPRLSMLRAEEKSWPTGKLDMELTRTEGIVSQTVTQAAQVVQDQSLPLAGCEFRDGTDRILVIDPDGTPMLEVISEVEGTDSRLRASEVRLLNSLVAIQRRSEIVVLDTLRNSSDSREMFLWRKPIGQNEAMGNRESSTLRNIRNALGVEISRISTSGNSIARMGPVTADGVLMLRSKGIECYDLLTGRKVWELGDIAENFDVVAGDGKVVIIENSAKKRRVLDARDGALLDVQVIEPNWEFWSSNEHRVLSYQETRKDVPVTTPPTDGTVLNDNVEQVTISTIRYWDAITGEVLLQKELGQNAKAALSGSRYLVALDEKGVMTFWDLVNKFQSELQGKSGTNLRHVYLYPAYDRLILFTDYSDDGVAGVSFTPPRTTIKSLWVNGDVYALSATDGKLLWETPASLRYLNVPRQQAKSSPLLAVFRKATWFAAEGKRKGDRIEVGSLGLLDVRTGKLSFETNNLSSPSTDSSFLEATPQENSILVRLGPQTIRAKLTETADDKERTNSWGVLTEEDRNKIAEEIEADREPLPFSPLDQ